MKQLIGYVFVVLVVVGCAKSPINNAVAHTKSVPFPNYEMLTEEDRATADSILAVALDHEALYSLMGDLKPISSVGFSFSYPLGKDSTHTDGQAQIVNIQDDTIQNNLAEIKRWHRILDALTFDRYRFLLVPFKQVWDGTRNFQILVCRTDLIDSLLIAEAPFFTQWGFVPGTDPAILLTAIEFENQLDRYRAYGYLFGYPKHAVNFFVEASRERKRTGKFVKRSFFHIPVYVKKSGHFTYALPKDSHPLPQDSLKYHRASKILKMYQKTRPHFLEDNGRLQAVALYRKWWRQREKNRKSKIKRILD